MSLMRKLEYLWPKVCPLSISEFTMSLIGLHSIFNTNCSSMLGLAYESYQLGRPRAAPVSNTDEFIYRNLSTKHHVLRKVPDCRHCGALRFPFEGPAFCCRKGKVDIITPDIPEELKRLFTSQDDEDAKYFREHIRYFNSHFSFTTLGVTLDRRVSTAAGTGVYTFRACGGLYHALDGLVPADNGPRHLQLYIYDTDQDLVHRAMRSPDLNIDLIRKILRILERNPYAQVLKSLGSVPNLDEYRISLNTDINLDQRRYNAPTTSQVAAIWVEGSDPKNCFDRSVVVHGKKETAPYILEHTMGATTHCHIHYSPHMGRLVGIVGCHMLAPSMTPHNVHRVTLHPK